MFRNAKIGPDYTFLWPELLLTLSCSRPKGGPFLSRRIYGFHKPTIFLLSLPDSLSKHSKYPTFRDSCRTMRLCTKSPGFPSNVLFPDLVRLVPLHNRRPNHVVNCPTIYRDIPQGTSQPRHKVEIAWNTCPLALRSILSLFFMRYNGFIVSIWTLLLTLFSSNFIGFFILCGTCLRSM